MHDSLFDLKPQPARSYEKDRFTVMNINVEMSLDKVDIERENYSFLDVLSDAGGIQSIFITVFSVIIALLNYKYFDTYMASRLFKLKKENADTEDYKSYFDKSNYFRASKCNNIPNYIADHMPSKLCCCKKSRK